MIKKNLLPWLRYTLVIAVVSSLVVISGCDDDEPSGDPPFEGTVWELINQDKFKQAEGAPATEALDSLVKYLEFYGLSGLLNTSTDYTLFAPSNQAFVNLLTTTPGFPENIKSISADIVAGVLAYHVTEGVVLSDALIADAEFETLFAQPDNCGVDPDEVQIITVNDDGTLLTGSSNAEIEIVSADNETLENGVVHITESVLIPPSVGEVLTPILTTMAATVLLSSDFEIMAGLLTYADCNTTGVTPIVNILANPAGTLTLFLPADAVFIGGGLTNGDGTNDVVEVITYLATNTPINTPDEIRALVLNHIHGAAILDAADVAAAAGTNLTMVSGASYAVTAGPPLSIGAKPIAVADADERDNGIAHVIGGILGL